MSDLTKAERLAEKTKDPNNKRPTTKAAREKDTKARIEAFLAGVKK